MFPYSTPNGVVPKLVFLVTSNAVFPYSTQGDNDVVTSDFFCIQPQRGCDVRLLLYSTPNGVASIAQGWRFAYPGKASKMISNPKGVAACLMGVLSINAVNPKRCFSNAK
jgi:hypothetical protein